MDMTDTLINDLIVQGVLAGWSINEDYQIITNMAEGSIGTKRNDLLEIAQGQYLLFFDSDDKPGANFIKTIKEGIKSGPDCLSLRGIMTTDGENPEIFEHSIKYSEWKTTENEIKYERNPNHLNCIKSEIAKKFKFKEINHGEDKDWSDQIQRSGLLKSEVYSDEIIYYYLYRSNK